MRKSHLLAATSFAALCAMLPPAFAAEQAAQQAVDEVIVSASRINISGYEQPTPVTVVSTEALQRDAQTNLGGIFRALPSFGVANSPDTSANSQAISNGGAGTEQVSLRNLTPERTLVLVNGVRVVGTELGGGAVDLNMIPSMLVSRVDVVTGGASAAWGSDAIAGVVNFVMNDNFDGIQASIDGANNHWLNKVTGKAQVAYGTAFNSGRGRFIVGLSYLNSPLSPLLGDASWRHRDDYIALMPNPAYGTGAGQTTNTNQYFTAHNVGLATKTSGGLITGCQVQNAAGAVVAAASCPLRGTQFVGPNGTPQSFNFGLVSGLFSWGGDAQDPIEAGQHQILSVPNENIALYNRVTYDVTDNVRARLEINATRLKVRNSSITYQRDINIRADNAFLDPAIAARMASAGLYSFTLGTTNINNLPKYSNPNISERIILGNQQARSVRKMERFVFGLDGDIGERWKWDAYVHYSTAHRTAQHYNIVIVPNYNLAVDAVRVTAANQGNSGIPIGTIVCRSTLTNPTAGFGACKPLNLFGDGVASQEAIDYVNPPPGSPYAEVQHLRLRQYTASFSVSGELFDLPAGPVAVAAGFDHRRDHTQQTANAMAYALSYSGGNYQPFKRGASTREFFGEVAAPLIKDGFVRSLDINGAVRATHYAQSGTVVTWKGGAVSQLTDDVRLRGTISRDIRAPSLFQMFNPGSFSGFTAIIPGQATSGSTFAGGNPNLQPEKATTYSAGAVLTPQFVDGLSVSADWYFINIKDVFFTPNSIQAYNQCQAGNQTFCAILLKDATGFIYQFNSVPVNASRQTTKGVDIQADYRFDAFNGEMVLSATAAYMYEQRLTTPVSDYDIAGSLNLDLGGNGIPMWRGTAKLTYNEGPFSGTIQTRYVGSGAVNKQFHEGTGPNSIDNNKVPATAYLDLRASYNFGEDDNWQIYAAIDNLLDINPALIPSTSLQFIAGHVAPTNNTFYDSLGRSYRYGVRVKF